VTSPRRKEDAALSAMVALHSFIHALHYYETLDSTNAMALSHCASGDMPGATLVISDFQSEGKGRMNKTWESSPAEDILMSLVLKPNCAPDRWAQLSFPLGIAIRDALKRTLNHHVPIELKWPNDILVGGKKCVGMLHAGDVSTGRVILGIGINVNQDSQATDRTSLKVVSGKAFNRWAVLNEVLTGIGAQLTPILSAVIDSDAWNSHAAYVGKQVQVLDRAVITGEFKGIDSHGAALIQTRTGIKRTVLGSNFRLV
jgi:BirA family biotin operon repressor/biotin-[acetyl-CoA-carboxylase] ligase